MNTNQEKKLKHEMQKQCSELEANLRNKKKWSKNDHCIHNKNKERDDK